MEGGDGQPKSWGCRVRCRSKCSSQSVVVFPHQDGQVCVVQDAYPPNNTVSIERRSPDIVLKRGAEDPELLVSSR